jgi:CRP-like cAMP-binding protein
MKEFAIIHEHGDVPATLRTLPFLGSFDDDELDDVLNSSSYIRCEPGDLIIEEGALDSRIYILLSGSVHVNKGSKTLATIARVGEIFGELAVVNQEKRSASVIAATDAVCLVVDQKFLQDVKPRKENPNFYAALYEFIARVTAGRLEATSRRLAEVEKELRELKAKHQSPTTKHAARPHELKKAVAKKRRVAKTLPAARRAAKRR